MKFDLRKPCNDCPFLKNGGIRLTQARVSEIAESMLSTAGSTFACHKTTIDGEDEDGNNDRIATAKSQHCAGALIFAEKHQNATQMMRIAERLGLYDAKALMANKKVIASVFDSLYEMLATNRKAFGRER